MPRSREYEPEEALEKAMQAFWQKGYSDTSLEDLVERTGVSRYGLYSTFGDKHDLFMACLTRYRTVAVAWLLTPMEAPDASLAAIRGYFDSLVKIGTTPAGRMGCLICNTAIEVAPIDRDAAKQVNALFQRMRNAFRSALTNAKKHGEVSSGLDEEAHADYLTGVAQGLFVLTRSSAGGVSIQSFVQVALEALR
jgi:TetR/AcrR family transcriptional repressor of nem operon